MKSTTVLLCMWALALAVSVHAQQSCPLTAQDLSSLNYTQVNSGCGEFRCIYAGSMWESIWGVPGSLWCLGSLTSQFLYCYSWTDG